jgi:DNA-directed RNA polymerase subunit RPC12/RpoP
MDLTPAEFVLFIVLGSFGLVVFFAVISRSRHARAQGRANTETVVCRICLHAFEDLRDDRVVACPACGARNEKTRRKHTV